MKKQEWTLKRNCSIAPRQLAKFYASLCLVSLLLAGIFTLGGAWYVLIFSLVELSAVGAAFLYYARHACDYETIRVIDGCVMVELFESDRNRQYRLDARGLKVDAPGVPSALVRLRSGVMQVEVGRYLPYFKRRELAFELRQAMSPEIDGSSR